MMIVEMIDIESGDIIGYGVYDPDKNKIIKVCDDVDEARYYLAEFAK